MGQKSRSDSEPIPRLFEGEPAFVYATGPSLNEEALSIAHAQEDFRHIAISDYYRTGYPCDFFYACDQKWWNIHHQNVMDWGGSAHGYWCTESKTKDNFRHLRWIRGKGGEEWSTDPKIIHYGGNSGFQIMNIAFLLGITYMVLIGFNMCRAKTGDGKGTKSHFFGDHPNGLRQNGNYAAFSARFEKINPTKHGVEVVNTANPTALKAFPKMSLEDAIARYRTLAQQ